jgi:DNA invertase Pin-like site-specific DNA recombinase
MSTDRQDLSPLTQKEAIAAFAARQGLEVVRSYEDEGRSGLALSNRPGLKQLLSDVAQGAPFSEILVYDVSRWGRFQDADASAYYEYHCRLHGVQVSYVGEAFANTLTSANVLLKSMKRVMAAEYSRELAAKAHAGQQRVLSMGFHMGALPPLGYRRCSVSADGQRRKLLVHGERKVALTDRIAWVLAPEAEVALVRRICEAYLAGLQLEEVAALVRSEGWRTAKGKAVTPRSIRILLRHEALIGNFTWGATGTRARVIQTTPTRIVGTVPRIIDDATWRALAARLEQEAAPTVREVCEPRRRRSPQQLSLPLEHAGAREAHRRSLGSPQQMREHTSVFGQALCAAVVAAGWPAGFDVRNNVLTFWDTRVRVRLMWPIDDAHWRLERSRATGEVQHVLVARMRALYQPMDFLLLPAADMPALFGQALQKQLPRRLLRHWCESSEVVMQRLARIAAGSAPRRAARSQAAAASRSA